MERYLSALLAKKPNDAWCYAWTLQDKTTYWSQSSDAVANQIAEIRAMDVYLGIGWTARRGSPHRRATADQIIGIPAVWLDVDVGTHGHKHPNNPPTIDDALGILNTVPLTPTLIVETGGGLHAYWVFDTPWLFADAEERLTAARFLERWQSPFRVAAAAHGWNVDSTHDLPRVLRIPGTYNQKHAPPHLVTMHEPIGPTYTRQELCALLPDGDEPVKPAPKLAKPTTETTTNGYRISIDAQPPLEKLEALRENDPKFDKTWKRQRSDLGDQSRSGYDLAMCHAALRANWTNQEIIDLLVAWRKKHGEPVKFEIGYYTRTIDAAQRSIEQQSQQAEIADAAEAFISGYQHGAEMTDELRHQILDALAAVLHVRIQRIIKYQTDNPGYRMVIDNREIHLGDVGHILRHTACRDKIASLAGVVIPSFKRDRWLIIAQMLLDACEIEDIAESAPREQVRSWLLDYFAEHPVSDNPQEAMATKSPFVLEGKPHLFLGDLQQYLTVHMVERAELSLSTLLRIAGCKPRTVSLRVHGAATSRYVWSVSDDLDIDTIRMPGGQ